MHEWPVGKIGLYTSKRFDNADVCYTKPLDSLKIWNNRFFWVDEFACPASFPWHSAKHVVRDPFLATSDFNAEDYATFVAHPSPFWKFSKPFLCLVGLSRHYTLDEDTYPRFIWTFFAFIRVPDPTKVRVVEREQAEGDPRVLETTFGRTVPLLPIVPDRADSDLEASENRLFDEGGSGAGGEQKAGTATGVRIVSEEDVAVEEPRRLRKKRQAATDVGGSSHPPKKLRSDYIAPIIAPSTGKSSFGLRDLLARSLLNIESGAEVTTTLPFVTSLVSATPEHDSGVPTAPEKFVISLDSSHPSANASEAEGSSIIRSFVISLVVTEAVITTQVASIPSTTAHEPSTKVVTPVHASMFQDSDSVGTVRPDVAGSSHAPEKELSLESREVNSESLHEVFVPDMDYEELFTKFSIGTARQACLNAELRMRIELCLSERRRLESQVGKQVDLLKFKDEEAEDVKARLLLKEAEAAKAIHLHVEASNVEAVEKSLWDERLEEFQDAQLKVVNDKLEKLYADFVDMALHLEEKFYPHLLTTIFGRRWLLAHGMELAVTKNLADVAAYNSSVEADYVSALQRLKNINFSLLAELRSSKDASVDTIMNILRLEDYLAKRVVVGATSLSFALVVSDARVRKIRENIASQRPALRDVFVPISEPFSAKVLMGTGGTSDTVSALITTTLSTTLAFADTVAPITVDDYGVVGIDDRAGADADTFLNVDDAELNMP
nr:hypothetical protein [Tanacetum cinerariifolium]